MTADIEPVPAAAASGVVAPHRPDAERSEPNRLEGVPDPPGRLGTPVAAAAGAATWAWRTIVVLACATLVLLIAASIGPTLPNEPTPPDPPRPDDGIGPVAGLDADDAARALRQRTWRCLCDNGRPGLAELRRNLHDVVEADFRPIYEKRIPEFLDWHYSVRGQYEELGLAAADRLEREIAGRLFPDQGERIRKALDDATETWRGEMRSATAQCIDDQVQMLDADEETRRLLARMLEAAIPETRDRFTTSAGLSSSVAVGTGLGGGLLVKALTKKLLASVAVKTAGKAAVKGAGTGAAAAGAAAGAALGPVGAAVGGILGGLAGWLGVDWGAVKLDERLTRDQLGRDLTALVDERRSAVFRTMEIRLRAFDAVCAPPPDETVTDPPRRTDVTAAASGGGSSSWTRARDRSRRTDVTERR